MSRGRDHAIDPKRRAIHRRMRRNVRLPQLSRLHPEKRPERAYTYERLQETAVETPKHWSPGSGVKPTKGFFRRLFNRKAV